MAINRSIIAVLILSSAAIAAAGETAVVIPTTGGLTLAGTLTTPAGTRPAAGWPALVLIQGSGPTDRDGNSRLLAGVKIDLLKQLANAMADAGVATIRFDKRGMDANRAQMPADRAKMAAFFDWDRFVDNTTAAYQFLDHQPGIDAARVGLLGHSEGGSLALVTAERLRRGVHPPAVLILMGTMGRPESDVLDEQLERVMKRQNTSDDQSKSILDANDRITAEIKRTGKVPADVPAGLAALYPQYLGPFLKGSLSVDGVALAAAFPGPVLVLNGERDVQVSATLDAGLLDQKLKSRLPDDHEVLVVPGASHHFKHVASDADPGLSGPIDDAAIQKLRTWCKIKLGASPAAA